MDTAFDIGRTIFGGILVSMFLYWLYEYFQIRKWKKVQGTIMNVSIIHDADALDSGGYRKVIQHEYYIDSERYLSDQIRKGPIWYDAILDWAKRRDLEYHPGKKVTVYYNPKKPKDAILERSFEATAFLYLIIGLAAIFYKQLSEIG